MTACSRALVGDALAIGTWVLLGVGLLVLWRRTVVERRQAEGRHARALQALARQHPSAQLRPVNGRPGVPPLR